MLPDLEALVATACACGGRAVRARALLPVRYRSLGGEPATPPRVDDGTALGERLYRLECVACGAARWSLDECPRCHVPGRLAAALEMRSALTVPAACPRCALDELDVLADARAHVLYVEGAPSRRVIDAEPHEAGFQVIEVRCPDCEEPIAAAPSLRCSACGRSSLLKR